MNPKTNMGILGEVLGVDLVVLGDSYLFVQSLWKQMVKDCEWVSLPVGAWGSGNGYGVEMFDS